MCVCVALRLGNGLTRTLIRRALLPDDVYQQILFTRRIASVSARVLESRHWLENDSRMAKKQNTLITF